MLPPNLQPQHPAMPRTQPALQSGEQMLGRMHQIGRCAGDIEQLQIQVEMLRQLDPLQRQGPLAPQLIERQQAFRPQTPRHPRTRQGPHGPKGAASQIAQGLQMRMQCGHGERGQILGNLPGPAAPRLLETQQGQCLQGGVALGPEMARIRVRWGLRRLFGLILIHSNKGC